jgi:hypothetical protein
MKDTCPNGCDLQGAPIPQEYIDAGMYAEGSTHYSRKIGIYVRGVYDVTLYWRCPDCNASWHRWPEGTKEYIAAQHYMEMSNA